MPVAKQLRKRPTTAGGELFHAPLYVGKERGYVKRGNWIGPGTRIAERLRRGDRGISPADIAANAHDIRYSLARSADDVRAADRKMVAALSKGGPGEKEGWINRQIAMRPIQAKMWAEDRGLIRKGAFGPKAGSYTGRDGLEDDGDLKLAQDRLSELEAQGYGRRRRRFGSAKSVSGAGDTIGYMRGVFDGTERLGNIMKDANLAAWKRYGEASKAANLATADKWKRYGKLVQAHVAGGGAEDPAAETVKRWMRGMSDTLAANPGLGKRDWTDDLSQFFGDARDVAGDVISGLAEGVGDVISGDGRFYESRKARGGGKRAPSAWVQHVKAYCAEHGCSYKDGMSLARASYRK